MSTTKLKASDRQALFRKIVTVLKKKYGGSVPKDQRNVLETMLFACCLEDAQHEDAEAAYQNLLDSFHDLNEIRVSSKKRDDLQAVIALLKGADLDVALQFVNYR